MRQFCSLDIRKLADKKANYHTHTKRCKHAEGEEREYIERAIEAGYQILGFSDHAPHVFEENYISPIRMKMNELEGYVNTIENLKKEYRNEIEIYTGLEMEFLPIRFEKTIKELEQYPLDYMILGQHFFEDEIGYKHVARPRNEEKLLETYVRRVGEALDTGYFMYVAHPDIINYTGETAIYKKRMLGLANELKKRNMPIEINVNGFRSGCNYPNTCFIEIGAQNGNDFIIGVDAHAPNELIDYQTFEKCVQLVERAGGKIINL